MKRERQRREERKESQRRNESRDKENKKAIETNRSTREESMV